MEESGRNRPTFFLLTTTKDVVLQYPFINRHETLTIFLKPKWGFTIYYIYMIDIKK